MNIWEVGFKLLANTGQASGNGSGLDVVGHIDCEEAESLWGGLKRKVIYFDKVWLRVESCAVIFPSRVVNGLSKSDRYVLLCK